MKLVKQAGVTSEIWQVFIQDATATTGAGLTGLTSASAGLTAYFHRDTDTTATAITLVSMTVGTFTASGFKEIDATNMPGWYQFCPPNAAIASGAKTCAIHLQGAANMAPLPIEVQLTAVNPDSATAFLTGVNSLAPPTNWNLTAIDGSGRVNVAVNSDKTGYSLSSAAVQAIWDALTSVLTTAGSIGKLLVDNINATISSRLAASSYTAPLTAAGTRTAVGLATANLDTQFMAIEADVLTRAAPGDAMTLTGAEETALTALLVAGTLAATIEGTTTLQQSLRLANAANGAKTNGGGTATFHLRDLADTKNRVTATVDANGNRSAVALNLT